MLVLETRVHETIWGGEKLTPYSRSTCRKIGHLYSVDCNENESHEILNGPHKGETFNHYFSENKARFHLEQFEYFPLVIALVEANDNLSIQVHPNDAYAAEHENGSLGKTECWYVLDCPEGAALVVGHNAKTREELKDMIEQGKWGELIREIPVKKGDFIQIDPGTVHAIKGGLMILETQQNSDITYRVYDYDRLTDGKPRQLHVKQSIDVITVPAPSAEDSVKYVDDLPKNVMNELISCDYYTVWKLDVTEPVYIKQDQPFMNMSVIEGEGLVNGQMIKKGDHFILPAGIGEVHLRGNMKIIASSVK